MSIKLMTAVWEIEALSASERLVLLCLADHANDEGICWPAQARIQERTGYTRKGVQKILKRLRDNGYLSVVKSPDPNRSTLYKVEANPVRPGGEPSTPREAYHVPMRRTTFAPRGVPSTPEPSLNHQEEPSREVVIESSTDFSPEVSERERKYHQWYEQTQKLRRTR